jgi:hypothetical protein
LKPHGSRTFQRIETSSSSGVIKEKEQVISAMSLQADLPEKGDLPVHEQESADAVSDTESHPSVVVVSYEGGEESQVTSARSLYADLAESVDVWVQQEGAYAAVSSDNHGAYDDNDYDETSDGERSPEESQSFFSTRDILCDGGDNTSYCTTARLISTQLMEELNRPQLILDVDSLIDKKLSEVLYRHEGLHPTARCTLEIIHICNKCRCECKPH